jgi:hypothetical protein
MCGNAKTDKKLFEQMNSPDILLATVTFVGTCLTYITTRVPETPVPLFLTQGAICRSALSNPDKNGRTFLKTIF